MATSYANSGGTGNRTALIWVQQGYQHSSGDPSTSTNLVDGATGTNTTDSTDFVGGQTGVHIIFDFLPSGFKQVIDEFKWIQNTTTSHGSWQFDGSQDGITWTTLKSSFTLVTAATTTHSVTNSTAYRMYRLLHVGGVSVSNTPWLEEAEFKLEAGAALTDPVPVYVTGDRTASITVTTTATVGGGAVTNLVNGNTAENSFFWNGGQTTREVKFDFGTAKIINEMRWYQSNSSSHGNWKWAGSNDDSSYTDLGGFSQALKVDGGGAFNTFSNFGGNTTGYRYYKMIQTASSTSSSPFLREIEFRQVSPVTEVDITASASVGISMAAALDTPLSIAAAPSVGVNMAATITTRRAGTIVIVCS